MASRGKTQALKNDAGVLFTVAPLTATDYSESIKIGGLDRFGIAINQSTVSGTNPTLDVSPEVSFDGGTNWAAMPVSAGAETAASLTQITTTTHDRQEWWYNPYGFSDNCLLRFLFTTGGTSESFTFSTVTFFGK